jgi:hypothetical protein
VLKGGKTHLKYTDLPAFSSNRQLALFIKQNAGIQEVNVLNEQTESGEIFTLCMHFPTCYMLCSGILFKS